jgi:hypothetical protein
MARQQRNDVDYFPFYCKEGKAMHYIESQYGNNGYATWIKILRSLATTNYHFLNLSDKKELMFLATKCRVSEPELINIINDLVSLDEFDKELWAENQIVYCPKLIDSIRDAYKKRSNKLFNREELCAYLVAIRLRNTQKTRQSGSVMTPDAAKSDQSGSFCTQTKVNYTKVKETIYKELPASEYLKIHCPGYLEQWRMKNPNTNLPKVFEVFDSEYICYSFSDDNHVQKAFQLVAKKVQPEQKRKMVY